MHVSTKAIVLSKICYGDNDLIVKCYTSDYGLKSYLLKGVLKSKKGRLRPAYFQLLSILKIEGSHKENRQLHYLKEVKVAVNLNAIHTNVVKSAIAIFLSEILTIVLKEEEQNSALFDFLETSIVWLDQKELNTNFHLIFLLELTKYLGFYPDTQNIEAAYFNLLEGRFQSDPPDALGASKENLTILKQLLGIKFDRDNKLQLNISQKQEFLNMILVYFKLHLSDFKEPKSLAVLNQVFR